MNTKQYDLLQHSNDLNELLAEITADTEILITRGGAPIARLLPTSPAHERKPGLHPGAFVVSDDFDEPLPGSFWMGEG
jgi:antitoxin (DNA-binding transcriptional repressor) of toxin-antitoxin stability system